MVTVGFSIWLEISGVWSDLKSLPLAEAAGTQKSSLILLLRLDESGRRSARFLNDLRRKTARALALATGQFPFLLILQKLLQT